MPDRFRKLDDEELSVIRDGLAEAFPPFNEETQPIADRLVREIEDEQTQRRHAEARQLSPA
jgi:hypothetical protein